MAYFVEEDGVVEYPFLGRLAAYGWYDIVEYMATVLFMHVCALLASEVEECGHGVRYDARWRCWLVAPCVTPLSRCTLQSSFCSLRACGVFERPEGCL